LAGFEAIEHHQARTLREQRRRGESQRRDPGKDCTAPRARNDSLVPDHGH
jgi:hypothetical protein